jgi:hypothetical protein
METNVAEIVSGIVALTGAALSILYARRAKKAEVRAKEIENDAGYIGNADKMIELVKKATGEAAEIQERLIETLKQENEKFSKTAERLERAIKSISRCPYRADCPVLDELQKQSGADHRKNGCGKDNRNASRHNGGCDARPVSRQSPA